MQKTLVVAALKVALPAFLGAAGAVVAALWSDGFRAFCGI